METSIARIRPKVTSTHDETCLHIFVFTYFRINVFTYCSSFVVLVVVEICQIISTKFGAPRDQNLMCTMLPDLLLGLPKFVQHDCDRLGFRERKKKESSNSATACRHFSFFLSFFLSFFPCFFLASISKIYAGFQSQTPNRERCTFRDFKF